MNNPSKPVEKATAFGIKVITREVYLVQPVGKSYFTEDAALNKYAHILASEEFSLLGKPTNEPDIKTQLPDGTPAVERGAMLPEYIDRQAEIYRELKEKLKDEKHILRLEKEWLKASANFEEAKEDAVIKYGRLQEAITSK
ncbi:hypothetical protein J0A78_05370 [Providencia rettgeri]|uniref:hypothetical protein n=1 Tax=Providencia rettgeri TaxID=587 RepID=UPI0019D4801C|nr:hypothetical protein [Providencia rettgeri]MBN7840902.1 hypothetical protein [Providencia rettgeri]MBN7855740.1 hypothetical protein [Providencia rettgeri]MBN7860985.1 hypothetical protein [Providencia rettgeri]MBN7874580.1 hypothetical protein [Providencia rettgeri]MBN7898203.1 hypothetical protein [Providencia rettgeri]